eukprot:CAMPEP_0179116850 /NCGR_PEP_ID=MMETSP0796-20121207/54841_1 /TAXON_ID=73915 /ORGANISM="Pyrodinium bahamense, Strain pbaha01" /LENGTH=33 /DNA_ID= /DNA_START= /DNA_END= /DNA_ORIENTATION=
MWPRAGAERWRDGGQESEARGKMPHACVGGNTA